MATPYVAMEDTDDDQEMNTNPITEEVERGIDVERADVERLIAAAPPKRGRKKTVFQRELEGKVAQKGRVPSMQMKPVRSGVETAALHHPQGSLADLTTSMVVGDGRSGSSAGTQKQGKKYKQANGGSEKGEGTTTTTTSTTATTQARTRRQTVFRDDSQEENALVRCLVFARLRQSEYEKAMGMKDTTLLGRYRQMPPKEKRVCWSVAFVVMLAFAGMVLALIPAAPTPPGRVLDRFANDLLNSEGNFELNQTTLAANPSLLEVLQTGLGVADVVLVPSSITQDAKAPVRTDSPGGNAGATSSGRMAAEAVAEMGMWSGRRTLLQTGSSKKTSISINEDTRSLVITGKLDGQTVAGLRNAHAVLYLFFEGSVQQFSLESVQLVLLLDLEVDYRPGMHLPSIKRLQSLDWLSHLNFTGQGHLAISSSDAFASSQLPNLRVAKGLNIEGSVRIRSADLLSRLAPLLSSSGRAEVGADFRGVFPHKQPEKQQFALALTDPTYAVVQRNVNMTQLQVHIVMLGSEERLPRFRVDFSALTQLRLPRNPPLDVSVYGSVDTRARRFTVTGELKDGWKAPFGLTWLSMGATTFHAEVAPGIHKVNLTSSLTLSIKNTQPQTLRVYAKVDNGELILLGNGLTLNSLADTVQDLVAPNAPDLSSQIDVPALPVSFVFSTADSGNITQGPGMPDYVVQRRGFGIFSKAGKGALVQRINELFKRPVLDFQADAFLPLFDNDQLGSANLGRFEANFEVALRTGEFDLTDRVRMLGLNVATRPLVRPPTLQASVGVRVTLENGDVLIFRVGGQVGTGYVRVGGSMLGTWHDAFGVDGFDLSDVALEIELSPAGITGFGFASTFTFGDRTVVQLRTVISGADVTNMYFAAKVQNLGFDELAQFYNRLAPDKHAGLPRIDLSKVDSIFELETLDVHIAPRDGVLQGLAYKKGFRFACNGTLFGARIAASVESESRALVVAGRSITGTDLRLSFDMRFSLVDFVNGLISLVNEIAPFDIDLIDQELDANGVPVIKKNDIVSLDRIAVADMSLMDMAQGTFPELTLEFTLVGQKRVVTSRVDFSKLKLKNVLSLLKDSLKIGDLIRGTFCITNSQCGGDTPLCNHRANPWVCVSSCPSGSVSVGSTGCWKKLF